jgi:hypothetical protein
MHPWDNTPKDCYFLMAFDKPATSLQSDSLQVLLFLFYFQATPKDKKASLVIHGLVDKVIAGVMCILNLRIPPYIRIDFIQLLLRHTVKKKCVRWTLRVTSIHGVRAPLSFLRSIEVLQL